MNEITTENATLHISGLSSNVTEKVLFEIFLKFGKIVSVKVGRDNSTRKSLGHGFIAFQRRSDAQDAMESVSLTGIMGEACRIAWFEKDILKSKYGSSNIVVKNLDATTTEREIYEVFGAFGKITSCKLNINENGEFLGSTFVNYENEKDAQMAIEFMHKTLFKKKIITVQQYRVLKRQSVDCYIENFPVSWNEAFLKDIFEKYGPVVIAKLFLSDDGTSKGCGFVCFKDFCDAVRATEELDGVEFQKNKIHVYQVSQKKSFVSSCNLYVSNLSDKMTDERLKELFQVFGIVFSVKVVCNQVTNKPKGYGFVAFINLEDGEKAIQEMNGKNIDGKYLHVSLKKSDDGCDHQRLSNNGYSPEPLSQYSNHIPVQPWSNTNLPAPPPSFIQPRNFVRMHNSVVNVGDNSRVKQILGEKLSPLVRKYYADKSGYIIDKLMDSSVEELFQMIDNEGILKMRAQHILDAMVVVDSYPSHTVTQQLRKYPFNNKVLSSDSSPSRTSSSEYSCDDDETEMNVKEGLCRKIFITVRNIFGDSAKEVLARLKSLSKTELFYMLEHEDYLRAKVDVMRSELKLQDCMSEPWRPVIVDTNGGDNSVVHNSEHIDSRTQSLAARIYPMVSRYAGKLAGRITDSFLDLDHRELQYMVDNEEYVRMKVDVTMSQMTPATTTSTPTTTTTSIIIDDTLKDDTLVSEIEEALRTIDVTDRPRHYHSSSIKAHNITRYRGGHQ